MSRYDGLIIPRSYSEYINKTDAATLQQALQLPGVLSGAVAAGDNKAVTSNAVNGALVDKANKTDLAGYVRCFDSVPGNNWNNAIEEGTYNIISDSVAGQIENKPSEYAVKVIVNRADLNDPYFVYQTAYTCVNAIRIRMQKGGGSWTEWKDLIYL